MKPPNDYAKILGLNFKERRVLDLLRRGNTTPLAISNETRISRPAIYEILERLHKRGLVKTNIENGRKSWSIAKDQDIERSLYTTKRYLLNISEGVEELHGVADSTVTIHRGADAIRDLLHPILKEHKEQRLYGIQGDVVVTGWNKVFGIEGTNELNRFIKKNRIIVEGIVPDGWFERQTKLLGKKWAKDFEGRMAITHTIPQEYFEHGGQIWVFKNSLYLIAINEEIVIEVRNSEIQKLILSMFTFIQDNAQKIDVNEKLRNILAKAS